MNPKILTLPEAEKLYHIIKPVYPERDNEEILFFLKDMFDNIQATDDAISVEILKLLLDVERDKIEELNPGDVLNIIMEGFVKNDIVTLYDFFESILND